MPVLPAKIIDFRSTFCDLGARKNDANSGTENRVIFEQLLDSDLAFQTLCFCDPSDGYVGGFRLTDEALLQNLERKLFFELHSLGTHNGTNRPCCSTFFSDN